MKLDWSKTERWHGYPYVVSKTVDGWQVTWHHQTAGVSHEVGRLFASAALAIEFAEQHADEHGGKPCNSR